MSLNSRLSKLEQQSGSDELQLLFIAIGGRPESEDVESAYITRLRTTVYKEPGETGQRFRERMCALAGISAERSIRTITIGSSE